MSEARPSPAAAAPTPSGPFYRRKWFTVSLGLLVTIGCIVVALLAMAGDRPLGDVFRQIGDAFRQADYRTLPLMWGLLFLFYWLKAWRWTWLLSPLGRFSTREGFPPVMIGFAFNNLLPAHLGEFVRVYVFSKRHKVSNSAVLSTVVLERIFDILAILGFFLIGLVFVPGLPETMRNVAWTFAAFVAVAVVGAVIYLIWTQPFVRLVEGVLARLPFVPAQVRSGVAHIMETGAAGLSSLKSAALVFHISWNSVLQWAINGLLMHISLWSFGVEVSPLATCLLLGVVAFGVTVPSSPGYFGVINALFVMVINEKTVGVTNEPAVFAASIYYHMSGYIPVTLLGLYFFNRTGLSVSQVQREAEEEAEELLEEEPPQAVGEAGRIA
ncbi:MAG: lysylphosphatidylglycerol synthase transmembrane domain-containing protein [Planctomycetaceae bacterium]